MLVTNLHITRAARDDLRGQLFKISLYLLTGHANSATVNALIDILSWPDLGYST